MNANDNNSERHPLQPFLPDGARVLMLGSFPPQRIRWSMEFFYPNLQNDMWRIVGYLATGDKSHFLQPDGRRFDRERIEAFCRERGIALYDTAEEVVRLKNNASDNFLQVVRSTDLAALLARIPACRTIVATG
ncbi:MAG: uracil-DNA glycosylase family protein, partial [Alistipes sp.]|nr:uracil-DNA glycosylase family protein [Alistipes sp.]